MAVLQNLEGEELPVENYNLNSLPIVFIIKMAFMVWVNGLIYQDMNRAKK
jgi:hypothetical protein